MSQTDKADAAEATPKKSKKKLIIMIVAVLLLAGASGGGYLMLTGGSAEAKAAPEKGAVVALEPITINLADGHYLKLGFALQATAEAHEEPDGSRALDLAIAQYTDMKLTELSSAKGRAKAKAELLEKLKEAYDHEVMDLYFTQFVTQ